MFRASWLVIVLGLVGLGWYLWPHSEVPLASTLSAKAALGKQLFFEKRLSEPAGQSCATCHDPNTGFADPENKLPTSNGTLTWVFGFRNSPTVTYSKFIPPLDYDEGLVSYVGGLFWDGRVDSLAEQAEKPFLNPLEMHNYNKWLVVQSLIKAGHGPAFRKVYGAKSLDLKTDAQANAAFANIADAISAYEQSAELNRFSSKFDSHLKGKVKLTTQEALGLELFNGKGRCAFCHVSTAQNGQPGPLFTNFSYHNLGIPKNWSNPFLYQPDFINPLGDDFVDNGLGETVAEFYPEGAKWEDGKFRTPTLRNIEKTAPYGHNGFFRTLKEIVHFYNTREVPSAGWGPPEVSANENPRIGNLGLTDSEEDAIVAFLRTLTDK